MKIFAHLLLLSNILGLQTAHAEHTRGRNVQEFVDLDGYEVGSTKDLAEGYQKYDSGKGKGSKGSDNDYGDDDGGKGKGSKGKGSTGSYSKPPMYSVKCEEDNANFCYELFSPDCCGPERWDEIKYVQLDFVNQCGPEFRENSPIVINRKKVGRCKFFGDYKFDAGAGCTRNFRVQKNDVIVDFVDCDPNPFVVLPFDPPGQNTFKALQLHCHLKGEHQFNGHQLDAECHIVHERLDGGRFAVVGTILEIDANADTSTTENMFFEELLSNWEAEATDGCQDATDVSGGDFDPYKIVPESNKFFYNYNGGLTAPPCLEVVEWNLAEATLKITNQQWNRFVTINQNTAARADGCPASVADPDLCDGIGTARPPVPIAGRELRAVCTEKPYW